LNAGGFKEPRWHRCQARTRWFRKRTRLNRDYAAADAGLREDYMAHRPDVERTVAQVATFRGRRLKLRYRGVAKNHAWLKRHTAALNLRNLLGKGLTRRDGTWVLAGS
jgi:hypothetical protein